MKWLNVILFPITSLLPLQNVHGQINSSTFRSWSAGLTLTEYGYDAGLGPEITSPEVFNSRVRFRAKSCALWMEDYKAAYDRWATYYLVEFLGVYQFPLNENMKPYFEAGTIGVLPPGTISNSKINAGLTGRAGIETCVFSRRDLDIAFYISSGITLVRATAENIKNTPRYVDGIVFATGLRFYFKVKR